MIVAILLTPLMTLPFAGKFFSEVYVESVGETYIDSLLNIMYISTDEELKDIKLMKERISAELERRR